MDRVMGQYGEGRAVLVTPPAVVSDLVGGADMAQGICSVDGCAKRAKARGWCNGHYIRWRQHGSPEAGGRARGACGECGGPVRSAWGELCPSCRPTAATASRARYVARQAALPCQAPECDAPRSNGPYCVTHRMRIERYGSLRGREREVLCECGRRFVSSHPKARYCTGECYFRFASKRGPRRAHHRAQDRIKRMRPAILARDGSVCHICRTAIDLALRFPHPLSLTIDHFIPISAGGSDEMENLRPAHLSCNVFKSDDVPTWWERTNA